MKTIPPLLLAELKSDLTSLAFIWTIEMADGRMIRGTEHDLDVTIPASGASPPDPYAGTYFAEANVTMGDINSTTDLSVDNLQVDGAFPDKTTDSPVRYTVLDVTVDDIESGLLDLAPVTILVCSWRNPSHGYWIAKTGTLGAINRDSDGKYTTEVRGLTQQLAQTIIRTFSVSCNAVKFGDARCKYPVADHTVTGHVTAVENRLQFTVSIPADSPPSIFSFVGGDLTFTSGANQNFFREVKVDPNFNTGVIVFWEQFPADIEDGDTFTLSIGCDRQYLTCKRYGNLPNFRGFGVFIPGVNALTAGPTTTTELGS
jgi:uncharacterized phage protein (TIGR02218 family)